MELLGKIFGNPYRVKIMRLFLFNTQTAFDIEDVVMRTRGKKPDIRKELRALEKIGFLKEKSFSKKVLVPTRSKTTTEKKYKKVKTKGWVINTRFELIKPLYTLLIDSELIKEKDLIKRIKKTGTIKLLILSGLFINDDDGKIDMLVVGDKIKKDALEREIAIIESEIGKELSYTFFDPDEFKYRLSMYDKLLRDILDSRHKKLINTLI